MEFTLTFNKSITIVGGVNLPAGAVFVGVAELPVTENGIDAVPYMGSIYASQTAKENGKPPLMVEGLHQAPNTKRGISMRRSGLEYFTKNNIAANDFNYEVEVVLNKAVLKDSSFESWKNQVARDLEIRTGLESGDIS